MNFDLAFRQGDILFLKIENLPQGCEKQNSIVIKEGETSGHSHKIVSGSVKFYKQVVADNSRTRSLGEQIIGYLEVTDRAVIGHEEHNPIYLPSGVYRILQQRVFNPFEEGETYGTD